MYPGEGSPARRLNFTENSLRQNRIMNIPPNGSQDLESTPVPKIWPLPRLMKRNPVKAVSLVVALIAIAVLLVKMWSLANGGMMILAGALTFSFVFILLGALRPRRAND